MVMFWGMYIIIYIVDDMKHILYQLNTGDSPTIS